MLQGPRGTLYAKNSNAGVVSVVTRKLNNEETAMSLALAPVAMSRTLQEITALSIS